MEEITSETILDALHEQTRLDAIAYIQRLVAGNVAEPIEAPHD